MASVRIPFESVERLVEPFSDVGWRVQACHGPGTDPGSRLTTRLVGLVKLDIVHSWQDVGGVASGRGRRTDLILLRHRDTGAYRLFLFGPGAGHGLWPSALAEAVLGIAPTLRDCCAASSHRVG